MNISDRDLDPTRRDRGATSFGDDSTLGTEAGAGGGTPGTGPATGRDTSGSRAGGGGPTGSSAGGAAEAAGLHKADELVDEIMPEEVDWQRLVRDYPIPALLLAAGAGFFLGMRRGPMVVGALSGWAAGEMSRRVNEILGDDVF